VTHPDTSASSFPLGLPDLGVLSRQLDDSGSIPYLVAAMFTDGYSEKAERLARSCREHGLPHLICQVPQVHRSISPKGGTDLRFTKANFIHSLLDAHNRPVLYVDADCFISEFPAKIEALVRRGYDFAIYNWLAEEHTESYVPVEVTLNVGGKMQTFANRFYRFSHRIDYYTLDQLICSGATQLYNNTREARNLLRRWHEVILMYPESADDQCLDYAFNNPTGSGPTAKAGWLPKAYARYAWWIYERPVINHPDMPYQGDAFRPIPDSSHGKRFYPERAELRKVEYYFPRDCLIDTERRMLIKGHDGQLIPPWQPITRQLWL
jgi:hypothetical protein